MHYEYSFQAKEKTNRQLLTLSHLKESRVRSLNNHIMFPKIQNIFALKP